MRALRPRKAALLLFFFLSLAFADEIDAEIVKSLDFYQNLDLLKSWELATFYAGPEQEGGARPASSPAARPIQTRNGK